MILRLSLKVSDVMKKPVNTFLKVFLSIVIIGIFLIIGLFIALFSGIIDTTSDLNIDDYTLNLSSYVFYKNENTGEYEEFERLYAEENRSWVDISEIPQHVQNAAIAIEDERFMSHNGVDFASTLKATFGFLFNNSTSRGGSTITQQLVKNLTGERDKSVTRKIQEIFRAIQLERKLSKDEILELYLNSFYLGEGCNGIKSASLFYFGKDVSELSVAEGACLVGITQYPTLYDPLLNPKENKKKQELVLAKMYELGFIDKKTYDEALNEKLVFVSKPNSQAESKQSYFVDEIINDVLNDLQEELGYSETAATKMLYSGGLKIYSTVDPEIQKIADDVFTNDDNLAAGPNGRPQASMCIIEPTTGEIKAIVGGFGKKTASRTLNRATQTTRQPGSSIKPIAVYAPAVENGIINPYSVYTDKQISIGSWSPKNYYNGFKGKVTVKYAVDISINTVPIQVLQDLGINKSYDFVTQKLGITSLTDSDRNLAALALGGLTKGVINKEITAAYCAFVNDGVYISPITYTKVIDNKGNVILEKSHKRIAAMKASTAKTMNGLLKSVCDSGTGTQARFSSKYTIAGKTGTTDDDIDRWFIGYTPYYCAAVWVGYDTPMTLSFYNSNPTIPLWRKVMERVHDVKKLKSKSFKYTQLENRNIVEKTDVETIEGKICSESGLKATAYCPHDMLVDADTSSITEYCKIHIKNDSQKSDEQKNNESSGNTKPDSTESTEKKTPENEVKNQINDSHLSSNGL